MDSTTLYFRQGPSDKVYQASIQPKDQGFMVHFAYGRRGTTLTTGCKTQVPVEYQVAKAIYDKLIREKTAKGYAPGPDTAKPKPPDAPSQHSGIHCQLLNSITDQQLDQFLFSDEYWMQEKLDGRRLLLRKDGDEITGINRLGFPTAVPETIRRDAAKYPRNFLLDGEAVGDTFHAFDLLTIGSEDMRNKCFSVRYLRMRDMLNAFYHQHIREVKCLSTPGMAGWFHQFKREGKEGVVFKHKDAPYTPGRPNSGGSQLKYKFYETASFIVTKVNDQRSVALSLFESGTLHPAGNVTIPPNHDIPEVGAVVDCRYLYAFKESGSIYQPVFLGPRGDIRAEECTISQLKYKAEVPVSV
ncbi:WGR domain-containing protein [Prosthecobacter vanneervenii]|uniref:Bifunctional non-homologous end joining protein LigD n=1 Tax=Prosthecobacter vanneervenii TaxID=48466 RepID=A0A7W7Y6I8_9BACT|nr:WGR domain-containing protein [Prosthecobacter vanneervenii]MBB5030526.1 bifunctional non-homologous end joining protein LigD [Prosthecobacter vanneervenii]